METICVVNKKIDKLSFSNIMISGKKQLLKRFITMFMLTRPRLKKYLEEAKRYNADDEEDYDFALRLYIWNTALGAAFYGPLQALEITLRNAVNKQFTHAYSKNWHSKKLDETKLGGYLTKEIEDAQKYWKDKKNKEIGKSDAAEGIISQFSLRFWVKLFKRDDLWNSILCNAFQNENLSRYDVHSRLENILTLRNDIAHHEPIFDRPNLEADMANILDILGWLNPEAKAWVEKYERVHDVIKMRPPNDPNDANLRF